MLQSFVPPLHLPRARIEPIRSATEALSVVSLALSRPLRKELVIVACDHLGTGHSLSVFDIRESVDELAHDVVGHVSSSAAARGVIAAHVHPDEAKSAHQAMERSLAACLARAGLTLLHFFAVQHGNVSRQ